MKMVDATHSSLRVIETRLSVEERPSLLLQCIRSPVSTVFLGSRAGRVLRQIYMTSRKIRSGMLPRSVQLQSV